MAANDGNLPSDLLLRPDGVVAIAGVEDGDWSAALWYNMRDVL